MNKLIHINEIHNLFDKKEPVDIKVWKSNGEIMECRDVILTSRFNKGHSMNIRFNKSGEIRKIKTVFIFEINKQEVFL